MKKHIAAVFACLVVSFVVLDAHVIVTPRESTAGAEEVYTVSAMAEGTVSATALELEIPAGVHVMQVAGANGVTYEVKKDGDRISSITWKSEIKPKGRALYTFTAHNPQPGALQWKAHQTFADGSMKHWVGERGSKEPASVTTVVTKGEATKAAPEAEHKH